MGLFDDLLDAASSVGDAVSSVGDTLTGLAGDALDSATDVLRNSLTEGITDALVGEGMSLSEALTGADALVGQTDLGDILQRLNPGELAEQIDGMAEADQLETVTGALQDAIMGAVPDLEAVAGGAEIVAGVAESAAPEILPLLLLV